MGKVQLLLNHWLYPFIIHTKQQQCIEVQFRLENTYVQLRVWLQSKNKNDWILLRERRKYVLMLLDLCYCVPLPSRVCQSFLNYLKSVRMDQLYGIKYVK